MKNLNLKLQEQFNKMCSTQILFVAEVTGQEVWELYLSSFEDGQDPTFRDPQSSTHNCNLCHNFIRRYGNIISVDENYNLMTLFDFEADEEYAAPIAAISAKLKESKISDVFFETFTELNSLNYGKVTKTSPIVQLGISSNTKRYTKEEAELYGVVKPNQVVKFEHLHLKLPNAFMDKSGKSIDSIRANYRSDKDVFQRAMVEIPLDTLVLVRDLIQQGSLLDGPAHLHKVEAMIEMKMRYDLILLQQDNWCWVNSNKFKYAKFKYELIGVLCSDLAEGVEINKACQTWNKRVDPVNYMKTTAPITKKQIAEAQKFVEEHNYIESFNRRFATIDDILVDEIKHINSGNGEIKSASIFDNVKATSTKHKKSEFKNVEEISIEKFMTDVLPNATSIEALLTNKHENNLVSLTTADIPDSKPMFKWDNNYSWTFNGDLAGKSQLRTAVQSKGGRVDGVLRFSHSWNELEANQSLMDLHVFMPGCKVPTIGGGPNVAGRRVGWNKRQDSQSGGKQDVDYTDAAPKGYVPVENITFPDMNRLPEGEYTCKIHNWSFRRTGGKGKAEIEFNGQLFQYVYPATTNHQWITVAVITLKDGQFTISHHLPLAEDETKEFYGLSTNEFHKVNLMCLSPNHWGTNKVGNLHYLFMLDKCKSPTSIRSFHNENLNSELRDHRKVIEVLGATNNIKSTDKQLSGLGFNSTVRDELIVKVQGSFKRMLKIHF